jgi:hypothetical protein
VIGVTVWTIVLVGGILLVCKRLDREVKRIRMETNTCDAECADELSVRGKKLRLPKYVESKTRLLGLPLFGMAWGGTSSDVYRPRNVIAWIAIGDIATSPFLVIGAMAGG